MRGRGRGSGRGRGRGRGRGAAGAPIIQSKSCSLYHCSPFLFFSQSLIGNMLYNLSFEAQVRLDREGEEEGQQGG